MNTGETVRIVRRETNPVAIQAGNDQADKKCSISKRFIAAAATVACTAAAAAALVYVASSPEDSGAETLQSYPYTQPTDSVEQILLAGFNASAPDIEIYGLKWASMKEYFCAQYDDTDSWINAQIELDQLIGGNNVQQPYLAFVKDQQYIGSIREMINDGDGGIIFGRLSISDSLERKPVAIGSYCGLKALLIKELCVEDVKTTTTSESSDNRS